MTSKPGWTGRTYPDETMTALLGPNLAPVPFGNAVAAE